MKTYNNNNNIELKLLKKTPVLVKYFMIIYFVRNVNSVLFVFEIINLVNRYCQEGNKSFVMFYIIIINLSKFK